jgi:hypothetical protein
MYLYIYYSTIPGAEQGATARKGGAGAGLQVVKLLAPPGNTGIG